MEFPTADGNQYECLAKLRGEPVSLSEELEVFINRIEIHRPIDDIDAMTALQAMSSQRESAQRSIGFPKLSPAAALGIHNRMMKTISHQIAMMSPEP
jgi:hypothetical protein